MEWNDIYRDKELRWELIQSRAGAGKEKLYSIRVTQRVRAVMRKSEDFLEFLTLDRG